jgi:hypothetical protein
LTKDEPGFPVREAAWRRPPISETAVRAALRVLVAYGLGIAVGNVLWLPYTGVLVVVFAATSIVLASPLLLVGLIVAFVAHRHITAHLRTWCVLAPFVVTAAYVLLDRALLLQPINRAVWERAGLAFTCAVASSVAFYLISISPRVWKRH